MIPLQVTNRNPRKCLDTAKQFNQSNDIVRITAIQTSSKRETKSKGKKLVQHTKCYLEIPKSRSIIVVIVIKLIKIPNLATSLLFLLEIMFFFSETKLEATLLHKETKISNDAYIYSRVADTITCNVLQSS